jgi:hypothetical protein
MMDLLSVALQNLLTPSILFFLLGILAGLFKSDLEIPESISRYLAIYLMMAIGFKGGVALVSTDAVSLTMLLTIGVGVCFGFVQPLLGFKLLRLTTRLDSTTAAAVAAHYGSISLVTFATAAAFLELSNTPSAGYMVAVLALMEAPAIATGLYLAFRHDPSLRAQGGAGKHLSREVFTNGAIMLLLGAFLIGALTGVDGLTRLEGFLVTPFQGILALFLLDMGLLVSRNLKGVRQLTPSLIAFGIYMPLFSAAVGAVCSLYLGHDRGTMLLFMVLFASASYIAVPAAMRLALPQANAGIYIPLSLAVTFPFNILLGIPLYDWVARWLLS